MAYKSRSIHPPLCRACGKPIPKMTDVLCVLTGEPKFAPRNYVIGAFKTKAELQKVTNQHIVSIQRSLNGDTIVTAGIWDGESYVDEFFHNGTCAQRYAYMCARSSLNRCTSVAYGDALIRQHNKAKEK